MFEDNPVIVGDVNKRNKKQKILCVIDKMTIKSEIEPEFTSVLKCKNTYQLGYEIIEHERY